MASMMRWCLIFAALVVRVVPDQSTPSATHQVIKSLTRALQFFSLNVDQVNLDAGIGTRIAVDQLRPYTTCKHCKSIKVLVDLSDDVTWRIAQSVRHRQSIYYSQLSFLLMPGIFSDVVPFGFKQQKSPIGTERPCSSSPFIEKYSDQCLHALAFSRCAEMRSCSKLMSDADACRYSLTHQILYSMLVKRSTCSHGQVSPMDEHRLISRMLAESQAISEADYPETDRDLFMEQVAFGGLLGWSEFFQDPKRFEAILSWQHPHDGCFGNDTRQMNKREEMQMRHQCLSHRTSVAIAALAEILRYLLSRDI